MTEHAIHSRAAAAYATADKVDRIVQPAPVSALPCSGATEQRCGKGKNFAGMLANCLHGNLRGASETGYTPLARFDLPREN